MGVLKEIVISIAGSAIFLVLIWVFSRTARQATRLMATRVLGLDLEDTFRDSGAVASDLQAELDRARWVTVITSRGNDLQRQVFADTLRAGRGGSKDVRILLPDPDCTQQPDWIADREEEISAFDHAYGNGLLREQVRQNVTFLEGYMNPASLELRLYHLPHVGRIILTDRAAYLTRYQSNRHGHSTPVKKYRRGDMYDYLSREVELVWKHARRVGPP
ncbi:hypothetical protein ACFWY6_03140 [Streptomyces sp. NPDC059037]|uniref:hypothetical protein n=1 Tax=Streptomyces sp. NPDC059037 TaxID=3346710 RepID=UPI00367C019A